MQQSIKRILPVLLLVGGSLFLSGCMKTKVMTGKPASAQTAELPWAHGFVFGLVPPTNAPLNVEPTCGANGVSEVYFRQTFVQRLAQGLTQSIYTPQKFTVTCASGSAAAPTPSESSSPSTADRK
jgi:hypothetical protein